MTTKNILTTAILAAAGLALSATSAQAAALSYSTGDLLLGVRVGGPAADNTKDYILKLGSYSQFLGGPTNLSLGSIGSDMSAMYGAGWASRSDLFWSVAGFENTTKSNTIYITAPEVPQGTAPGAPTVINSNTTQALATGRFSQAGQAYANALDSTSGSGGAASNAAGLRQLTADPQSWASFNGSTQTFSGNSWSYFSPATEGNFSTALDLFQVIRNGLPSAPPAAGAINNLGYFAVSGTGAVTFNSPSPSPVPEPTGIAVGILAGLTGLVSRRRQRATVA